MVWFTGDQHFCHDAAPTFDSRNFQSLKEMHRKLIEQWNLVVEKDDIVWVLGDFFFTQDTKILTKIVKILNGKKYLVKGNHESLYPGVYINAGFSKFYDLPVLFNNNLLLSHEPVTQLSGEGLFNIHAHTHGRAFDMQTPKHYCVSVDATNFRPVSVNEIYQALYIL